MSQREGFSWRMTGLTLLVSLIPVLLFLAMLFGPTLHLAQQRTERNKEYKELRQNVYRPVWLDSTMAELKQQIDFMRILQAAARSRQSTEAVAERKLDPLRQEMQGLGIEVARMSLSQNSNSDLKALRSRWETRATYAAMLTLFRVLRESHSEFYCDEITVRRDGKTSDQLALSFTLIQPIQSLPLPGIAP